MMAVKTTYDEQLVAHIREIHGQRRRWSSERRVWLIDAYYYDYLMTVLKKLNYAITDEVTAGAVMQRAEDEAGVWLLACTPGVRPMRVQCPVCQQIFGRWGAIICMRTPRAPNGCNSMAARALMPGSCVYRRGMDACGRGLKRSRSRHARWPRSQWKLETTPATTSRHRICEPCSMRYASNEKDSTLRRGLNARWVQMRSEVSLLPTWWQIVADRDLYCPFTRPYVETRAFLVESPKV
jgi:hypothetical protein